MLIRCMRETSTVYTHPIPSGMTYLIGEGDCLGVHSCHTGEEGTLNAMVASLRTFVTRAFAISSN